MREQTNNIVGDFLSH